MTLARRSAIAIIAISLSMLLLHRELSSALVSRADTLAYFGNDDAAMGMYLRALALDSTNAVAADRFVFRASLSSDATITRSGLLVARAFLVHDPSNVIVRFDRALCFQRLHLIAEAASDFARAGTQSRDPRALMFAALDEKTLHHASLSRRLLVRAVAFDRGYTPAIRALKAASI